MYLYYSISIIPMVFSSADARYQLIYCDIFLIYHHILVALSAAVLQSCILTYALLTSFCFPLQITNTPFYGFYGFMNFVALFCNNWSRIVNIPVCADCC